MRRRRRFGARQFRRMLFTSTQNMPHYRSVAHLSATFTNLGTSFGTGTVYLRPAITVDNAPNHANPFWTVPGGCQQLDIGVTPPDFRGDITIRGGTISLFISPVVTGTANSSPTCLVKVWLVWAKPIPDNNVRIAIEAQDRSIMWEPSSVAEFSDKFGRVVLYRESQMKQDGGDSMRITHLLHPQKLDQQTFNGVVSSSYPAGSQFWWMWQVVPLVENLVADSVDVVTSFNLSFTGDAVT